MRASRVETVSPWALVTLVPSPAPAVPGSRATSQ